MKIILLLMAICAVNTTAEILNNTLYRERCGVFCNEKILKAVNKFLKDGDVDLLFYDRFIKENVSVDRLNRLIDKTDFETKKVIMNFIRKHFKPLEIPPSYSELDKLGEDDEIPGEIGRVNLSEDLKNFVRVIYNKWDLILKKYPEYAKNNPDKTSYIITENDFMVTPGGNFMENYYWDTYWAIKGMLVTGLFNEAKMAIENLLEIVNTYGFMPNGNRKYYLDRSQPPFLTQMVYLYHSKLNNDASRNLVESAMPILIKEYDFWMDENNKHVVSVTKNGETFRLNRYYSEAKYERPESWKMDNDLVKNVARQKRINEVFKNIHATAESGWDFSSRFTKNDHSDKTSLETINVLPVDLNAFMYENERILAEFCRDFELECEDRFSDAKIIRKRAIHKIFYSENLKSWFDYSINKQTLRENKKALSNYAPLFTKAYFNEGENVVDISAILDNFERSDFYQNNLPATLTNSGLQWDFPNAWSPLVHMIVTGLEKTETTKGHDIAVNLAHNWIRINKEIYNRTGNFYERINSLNETISTGGQYPTQIGFAWTNGVLLDFITNYGESY